MTKDCDCHDKWDLFINYMRSAVDHAIDGAFDCPSDYARVTKKGKIRDFHAGDIPDYIEIVQYAYERKMKKIMKKIRKMDTLPGDIVWQNLHDAGFEKELYKQK